MVEYIGQMTTRCSTLVEEMCKTERADPYTANISSMIRATVIEEVHDELAVTNASIQELKNMLMDSLSCSET